MIVKRAVFAMFLLTVIVFLWMGQEQRRLTDSLEVSVGLPHVGHLAPDFQLQNLYADEEIQLSTVYEQHGGVVVYFWTSWCPFCASSMEALQRAYESYGEDVAFLGVNVTSQDTLSAAQQFLKDYQIGFINGKDETGKVAASYFVPPVPATLFISREGSILHRKVGGLTYHEIEQGIRQLEREK